MFTKKQLCVGLVLGTLMIPPSFAPVSAQEIPDDFSAIVQQKLPDVASRRSSLSTLCAVREGTAKPMPILPRDGETIAVLTPITSPRALNSGPPELPLFMDASVCRKSS